MGVEWGDLAGWWGAATGTLALGWEIYRHFTSGPRLKFSGRMYTPAAPLSGDVSLIALDVWNQGDAATTVESMEASQDGRRFLTTIAYSTPPRSPTIQCPARIGPGEHIAFTVTCSDDVRETPLKLQKGRPLAPEKPVKVFIRTSASEKEIVVTVPACPRRPAGSET